MIPPPTDVLDGLYGFLTFINCRKHFEEPSADMQRLSVSHLKVRSFHPIAVTEDEIIEISVAVRSRMEVEDDKLRTEGVLKGELVELKGVEHT